MKTAPQTPKLQNKSARTSTRGGARLNSGPKPLGHSTKQIRITAPLEDMEIITTWLKSQKNAARAVAQMIKDHATRDNT
jgi:hypothetical protein